MGILEILLISVGLAMDAFAASICKGLSLKKIQNKALIIALYFGLFQGLMPLIGYFLANSFTSLVTSIDHWIAFILLTIIGFNMVKEALDKDNSDDIDDSTSFKTLLVLAIATSIDALAVGISFAFLQVNILSSSVIIAIITFTLSYIGVHIGHRFGLKLKNKAELVGGIILILIGTKILIEHLGLF